MGRSRSGKRARLSKRYWPGGSPPRPALAGEGECHIMVVSLRRRRFIAQALGSAAALSLALAGGSRLNRLADSARSPQEEVGYWQFTSMIRCTTSGFIEEQWCYYECFGGTCTPVQYEWRATGRRC